MSETLEIATPAATPESVPIPRNKTTPAHLAAVDGLRGAAALLIVVYHCFTNADSPEWRPFYGINVLRPLTDGWCGVNLFLVLSGFCLYWPYARKPERRVSYASHMKRRSLRILPAYYASLLLVPLMYLAIRACGANVDLNGPRSWSDAILHLTMLHSFSAASFNSWNGVTWSLGLEWCWYLLFPLAVWIARKRGIGFLVATGLVITVAYRVAAWVVLRKVLGNYETGEGLPYATRAFVLGRLLEFSLGMWVAVILARGKFTRGLFWAAVAAVFGGLVIGRWAERTDVVLPVRDIAYGLMFAALLLVTVWPATGRAAPGRVMGSPLFQWIGECSFSLYLFHLPWVIGAGILVGNMGYSGPEKFVWMLAVIPVTVIFARLMYPLVERPFMSMGRAIDAQTAARVAPAHAAASLPVKEELHVAV